MTSIQKPDWRVDDTACRAGSLGSSRAPPMCSSDMKGYAEFSELLKIACRATAGPMFSSRYVIPQDRAI